MSIRFVAIVGANNEPIYFHSARDIPHEVQVNQQFIAEMSMDFVEQQAAQLQASLRKPLIVMIHDGITVYAMVSNTRTKYLIGVDSAVNTVNVDDAAHAIANAYVAYQCNPFGVKQGAIKSPQFDKKIEQILINAEGEPSRA